MKRLRSLIRHPFIALPPLLYFYTACPGIGFGDTAIMIDAMRRGLINAQVNTHPLSILVGMFFQLLPVGEYAYRANLMSVFFGSLTVIVFYFLCLFRFKERWPASIAASFLMLSHSMWWHSTLVENYAASALIVVACLFLWEIFESTKQEKWLYALCAMAAFGMLNHVQLGFLCLGVAVTGITYAVAHKGRGLEIVSACAGAAAAGLAPWFGLVLADSAKVQSLSLALKHAFVGNFSATFFSGQLGPSLWDTLYLFWFQSPSPYFPFALCGLWLAIQNRGWRNPLLLGVLTFFLLNTVNFAFYATWDKFAFLLVSFIIFHYFASEGFFAAWRWTADNALHRKILLATVGGSLLIGPYLYNNIAQWALRPESVWHWRYNNNYAANLYFQAEYIVNPNKRHFREVERYATLLLDKLPPNSHYLDDDSRTYYCIADYYQRFYGKRPDVSTLLVNSWGISNWGYGTDTLSEVIARAYYLNRPFFVASLQSPFYQFIQKAKEKAPIEFVKFPLSEHQWIYRMVTASEKALKEDGIEALSRSTNFTPLTLSTAPAGFLDFSLRNLLFYSSGEPRVQNMSYFDDNWMGGDHIFISADKPGAWVELAIRSETRRAVRLELHITTAPDFGVVQIELLDKKQKTDLYNYHVQRMTLDLGTVELPRGTSVLKIQVVEKNPRSSGYRFGVDGLLFRPAT